MAQRIKGQETSVVIMSNGVPQTSLQFVKSLSFTFKTKVLEEGYLGLTTQSYDSIFDGLDGSLEFNFDNAGPFALVAQIVNKARRRDNGTQINIITTFSFPNGSKVLITILDAEFGPMPFDIGSRSDYIGFKLDFSASESTVIPL